MCTRVLWNTNELAVIVARTMDWPASTEPQLVVLPRGIERDGAMLGPTRLFDDNPLRWTARHGSMVTSVYGLGSADGFNERGLGAHMLFFNECDFGPRDDARPGLHAGLWAQYLLDVAGTVTEAIDALAEVDLVMAGARGVQTTVHLAVEDDGGDSAILEYLAGDLIVHHGREFTVMTNDPDYDRQLQLVGQYDFSTPTSDTPLPGNVNPRDRFARATYFSRLLPPPTDEHHAVASILAVARNVSVPDGAPYKGVGTFDTEYRTACDLTNRRYFFELTTSPNVIWAELDPFDLTPGSSPMALTPGDIGLSGDVTSRFVELENAPF